MPFGNRQRNIIDSLSWNSLGRTMFLGCDSCFGQMSRSGDTPRGTGRGYELLIYGLRLIVGKSWIHLRLLNMRVLRTIVESNREIVAQLMTFLDRQWV